MIAYITKYALTQGIVTVYGERAELFGGRPGSDRFIVNNRTYYRKPDWHATATDALKRAQVMRMEAIGKAHAKIKKLHDMTFAIKPI